MNRVVIQAGGKGARLHPYTKILPKPLLPVGDFPILEIVVRQLVHHGLFNITITLGHLGHLIKAVIGDGSQWGATIDYCWEDEPRGTIGALSQVANLDEPFLVMNGDLLTDFDYRSFLNYHLANDASISVGVYHKQVTISLGVLDLDDSDCLVGFREKPVISFPCSMGIYALNPDVLRLIPSTGTFGFDSLMALCLAQEIRVRTYHSRGLWLDIGRLEDYAIASDIFHENLSQLLPQSISWGRRLKAA